jgi:HEAT repeat protein
MVIASLAVATEPAAAQSIAQRVNAAGRGTVELRFAARPGVCGDGRSYYSIGSSIQMGDVSFRNGRNGLSVCLPGPARARLRLEDGAVTSVRVFVGPARGGDAPDTDLGMVTSAEAADYLLRIAETGNGRATQGAIEAAVLADSVSVWRRLLAIANDSLTRSRATRHDARFWVGRFAAAKSAGDGEDLAAAADDVDRDDPRSSAIFALAQLKHSEGVPSLLEIARSHRDPVLRKQALFWLGESEDPRAIALFEAILRR